jgi:hypothetical protein
MGTVPSTPAYEVQLRSVERPANAQERYGPVAITRTDSAGAGRYTFEDSLVRATFFFDRQEVDLVLRNKTSFSMKLSWDEAVFVDGLGESHRVMHSGVRYMERDQAQASSIIARGSVIIDILIPVDNVFYNAFSRSWDRLPMFRGPNPVGAKVSITLPLEVQGVVNEYVFAFDVVNAPTAEPPASP